MNRHVSEKELEIQKGFMATAYSLIKPLGLKAHIRTYGCQQNEADSERLAGMAESMGYELTELADEADLIVVNTCAVREHAELKALSITGQFKHLKAKNPELLIGICGCMVSQEHRKDAIKNSYPYVDFLFGTSMLYRFPEIVYKAYTGKNRGFYLDHSDGNIAEGLPVHRESSFKAWVSIMYGCNNFCTYCIVPYVRGRERSRLKEDILVEIADLAKSGYREITLLGQNVNSYGKDLYEGYDFADLLSDICKIEGDFLVRFMTSHPKDASEKLIDVMAENPKIAKAFHLPIQSGSDVMLKRMNRHYDMERYMHLVSYMREKMPDIAITTDIIVGFPGETEEDFEGTLSALREARYDNIYSFIYSPRKGTPAAAYEDQVDEKTKSERFARLLEVQNEISHSKNEDYVGKVIKVLVEGHSKTNDALLTGRNEKNRLVHFSGPDELIGNFAYVLITHSDTYTLTGQLPE